MVTTSSGGAFQTGNRQNRYLGLIFERSKESPDIDSGGTVDRKSRVLPSGSRSWLVSLRVAILESNDHGFTATRRNFHRSHRTYRIDGFDNHGLRSPPIDVSPRAVYRILRKNGPKTTKLRLYWPLRANRVVFSTIFDDFCSENRFAVPLSGEVPYPQGPLEVARSIPTDSGDYRFRNCRTYRS